MIPPLNSIVVGIVLQWHLNIHFHSFCDIVKTEWVWKCTLSSLDEVSSSFVLFPVSVFTAPKGVYLSALQIPFLLCFVRFCQLCLCPAFRKSWMFDWLNFCYILFCYTYCFISQLHYRGALGDEWVDARGFRWDNPLKFRWDEAWRFR